MNFNSEYYLFNIHVNDGIIKNNSKVKLLFNKIVLYSKIENLSIEIKERNFFIEVLDDKKSILLYVENSSRDVSCRIDYLFDDEYELAKADIQVYYENKLLDLNINPIEQISGKDIYNDFLFGLLSKQFIKEICCFKGLRPDELYGYNLNNKKYQKIANIISDKCIDLIENFNINTFISSGALGTDTISFFAVDYLKKHGYPNLKNVLAIPFEKHYIKWGDADIERYNRMLKLADYILMVDTIDGYKNVLVANGEYHIYKQNKCFEFMIDCSYELIVLWNNDKSDTHEVISYASYTEINTHILNIPDIKKI